MTGDDGKPHDRPQTCVRVSVSITPVGEARGDVAGLIGNMAFDLFQAVGLSRQISSKANVHLVEEITNVLEHRTSPLMGALTVALSMENEDVFIDVNAPEDLPPDASTDAWFPPDEPTATAVNPAMKTMRRKRADLTRAGLGLVFPRSAPKKSPRSGGEGDDSSGAPDSDGPKSVS